jgi:hypothetical protein
MGIGRCPVFPAPSQFRGARCRKARAGHAARTRCCVQWTWTNQLIMTLQTRAGQHPAKDYGLGLRRLRDSSPEAGQQLRDLRCRPRGTEQEALHLGGCRAGRPHHRSPRAHHAVVGHREDRFERIMLGRVLVDLGPDRGAAPAPGRRERQHILAANHAFTNVLRRGSHRSAAYRSLTRDHLDFTVNAVHDVENALIDLAFVLGDGAIIAFG